MTDETPPTQSTASKIGEGAKEVAATAAADAKAGLTWLSLHPDVMKVLAGLIFGIALGYLLFH